MNAVHPLKTAIEKRGYTINRLAEIADVPVSNIYSVTRGRSKFENMGVGAVIKIAHALGLTADELAAEIESANDED